MTEILDATSQGLSLLEKKAIGDRSARYYCQEFAGLRAFATSNNLPMTEGAMDSVLNQYFNHLFLQGHPAHRGDKILAPVMHRQPKFGRHGTLKLPHA